MVQYMHRHPVCVSRAQTAGMHAMRQWHRFRAAEVANLVWALAILKAPSPDMWCVLPRRCPPPAPPPPSFLLPQAVQERLSLRALAATRRCTSRVPF